MNKKELAKLLFQHKDIKSLFESRQFDASTLKKVISEEIMREAEGDGWKSDNSEETKAMIAQIKDLTATLDEFKIRLSDVKQEKRTARANNDRDAVAAAQDEKQQIDTDIDRLENRIKNLEANLAIAYERAGQTPTKNDDKVITSIASKVKDAVATADAEIMRSKSRPDLQQKTVRDTNAKLGTAIRTVDKIEPQPDATSLSGGNPAAEETDDASVQPAPQTPAGKGWKNAKSAARAKVTEGTTIEQIKASLDSADAFKAFWGVKGEVDTKMAQAKGLFDSKYFDQRIEELKAKATDEDKKEEVAEEAANLAATVMRYSEFLNNMMSQQPDFKPPEMDFPPAIPKDEKEFNRSFIQPLVKIQEPSDASVDKDGLKEDQYIELFTTNAAKNDVLKSITEKDLQVFGGWYIMSRQSKALNEETDPDAEPLNYLLERYGAFTDFWSDNKGPKFVNYEIKNSIKKRSKIKGLDPELKATLAGIQTLIDSGKISIPDSITIGEDPNKEAVGLVDKQMVQDVIENTPEVEPDADADLGPLATEEMDAAWTTTLNAFFGKDPTRSSFMRQLLLKHQASMLYGMIGVLEQIITGGAGDEERSLSNEKTQVKQKEEPVTPPAEADKKKAPPKTDTTSTDAPADEEENVVGESLEEQVINEIFGMFGGKDNKEEEIKFSPKSTSLMRQDLEAMVDLLRSLKADIGQYKDYSTSSSANPRYNGSTLKTAMDAKLKVVQQSIAHLAKVIDLEVQSQKDQLETDGAQTGRDTVDLQESSESDRKLKITEVEKVYNEMRRQYLKGLQVSLSKNQPDEAKAGAEELKDYVMGQETFMSYFPSNIITSSGGVMTLGGAHKSMVDIIAPFIETIRDIVTITKTQKVSESNLQQAIGNLVMISDAIESMFKVPSLIDREFMKKYIEAAKQNPENQPLTDEEPEMMDRMKDLAGKGLEKLKQMFSWMSEETGKLLLKFFGEESELIDGLSNSDLSDDEKQEIVEEAEEVITWFDSLDNNNKVAVGMFANNLIAIRGLNEVSIPTIKKLGDDIQTDKKKVLEAFMNLSKDHQSIVEGVIRTEREGLVGYLKGILRIKEKLGEEAAKELIDPSQRNASNEPMSAEVEYEDDEGTTSDDAIAKPDSESESETEEDSDSPTPPVAEQHMSLRLGYESPQDLEDKFKPQFEKIMQKLDLKFRDLDDLNKAKLANAIDYSSGLFLDIAKLVAKSTAKTSVQEGFGEKIKSWNQSRVVKKDSKNRLKLAKQIVKQSFPKVSTEAELGEDSVGQLVLGFLESFADDSSDAIKTLMKALGDNDGDIPKTLAKLKNAEEMKDFYNYSPSSETRLEESLRPIIEKMLNEHYNH